MQFLIPRSVMLTGARSGQGKRHTDSISRLLIDKEGERTDVHVVGARRLLLTLSEQRFVSPARRRREAVTEHEACVRMKGKSMCLRDLSASNPRGARLALTESHCFLHLQRPQMVQTGACTVAIDESSCMRSST